MGLSRVWIKAKNNEELHYVGCADSFSNARALAHSYLKNRCGVGYFGKYKWDGSYKKRWLEIGEDVSLPPYR